MLLAGGLEPFISKKYATKDRSKIKKLSMSSH